MDRPPRHVQPPDDGIGPDPASVRRIMVLRPGGLADVVRAIPALRHLRVTYPAATIHVAAAAPARELLQSCPYVDSCSGIDDPRLSHDRFDLAVSFAAPGTASAAKLDAVPAACRVRWAVDAGDATTRRPAWPERLDDTARMLRLAWLLGGAGTDHALGLWPTLADRNGAARLVDGIERPIALLHVGGSRSERRWPTEPWARVVELVDSLGLQAVLVGGEGDRAAGIAVAAACSAEVLDLTGRATVGELAGLLERATLFVGTDSGPAALAVAIGARTVVIAPANAFEYVGRPGVVDLVDAGPCAACGERGCAHPPATAADVPPDAVLAAVSLAAGRAVERWRAARID